MDPFLNAFFLALSLLIDNLAHIPKDLSSRSHWITLVLLPLYT